MERPFAGDHGKHLGCAVLAIVCFLMVSMWVFILAFAISKSKSIIVLALKRGSGQRLQEVSRLGCRKNVLKTNFKRWCELRVMDADK